MRKEFTIKINYLVRKPIMFVTALVALFGLQSFSSVELTTDSVVVVSLQPIQDEVEVKKRHEMKFSWEISRVETPGMRTVRRRNSTKVYYSKVKEPKLENTHTISSTTHPIYGELLIERLKTVDKKGNGIRETTKYNFSIENQPHSISINDLTDQVIKGVGKIEANVENKSITPEEALSTLFKVLLNEINLLSDHLEVIKTNSGTSRYDDPSKYFILSEDQIQEIPSNIRPFIRLNNRPNNGKVIGMEITENETLVDFAITPSYDVFWWAMSQNACLLDPDTGIQYKIRGIDGGIPLEELLIVKGYDGVELYFTLIFPPLDPGVKRLVFMEKEFETLVRPSNAGRLFLDPNLKVKKLQRRKARY